jgi:hypothetical protein
MPKPMIDPHAKKTVSYLESYLADLKYQYGASGTDYVNYNSSGTEYFKTDEDCKNYIRKLEELVQRIKYVKEV